MYQLWRFIKRGVVSQPHMVGGVIIGYFGIGIISYYNSDIQFNYGEYNEPHSHNHGEQVRQYCESTLLKIRSQVNELREQY
ncbi:unnamed protein product [Paramecium octaurelia]|uniref:Uncharacterized protein n=1 Tax=Paramecium octaurelia TaxID=43137 RepID=A0A8S1UZG7_PAROT|nr:unnamed protein product [Paramecium octaurelia]